MESGADIHAKDPEGRTPLHYAANSINHPRLNKKRQTDSLRLIFEILFKHNANINSKDRDGVTPLHLAASSASDIPLDFLLSKGANVNVQDKQGSTPLHSAVHRIAYRSTFELERLIKAGVDLYVKDIEGNTPLHIAAMIPHDYLQLRELYPSSSIIDLKNIHGKTPDDIFKFNFRKDEKNPTPQTFRISNKALENPAPEAKNFPHSGNSHFWLKDPSYTLHRIKSSAPSSFDCYDLNYESNGLLEVSLCIQKNPSKPKRITFVFPIQGENSFIPTENPDEGRIILVVPDSANKPELAWINDYTEVLFVSKIKGFNGEPIDDPSILDLLTSRRRAALYLAQISHLNDFMMLNDSIEHIYLAEDGKSKNWADVYNLCKIISDKHGLNILSARSYVPGDKIRPFQTIESEPNRLGPLGSSFFFFNNAQENIFTKLGDEIHRSFSPINNIMGENLWMQFFFEKRYLKTANINISSMLLKYAPSTFNQVSEKANLWLDLKLPEDDSTESFVLKKIQRIIEINIQRNEKEYIKVQNTDLTVPQSSSSSSSSSSFSLEHSQELTKTRKISEKKSETKKVILSLSEDFSESFEFHEEFKKSLENHISSLKEDPKAWQHHIQAFESLQEYMKHGKSYGFFDMPTGTGKTRIFMTLAKLLFENSEFKEKRKNIAVIVPTIDLVDKTKKNFVEFFGKNKNIKIAAIHSGRTHDSYSAEYAHHNKALREKGEHIVVFCEDSFRNYLETDSANLKYYAMVLIDEFHKSQENTLEVLKDYQERSNALVFAFSATTQNRESSFQDKSESGETFNRRIFKYTREEALRDGIIAPWHTDYIDLLDSTMSDTESFISKAPEFLSTWLHPKDGVPLKNKTGVIWVDSIKNAEKLNTFLRENGFISESVHSGKVKSAEIIDDFSHNNLRKLQVLIAVDTLTLGFDPKILDYIIIAKRVKKLDKFDQMLGRVLRKGDKKDKIAYLLAFSDGIPKSAGIETPEDIKTNLKLHPSYLLHKILKKVLAEDQSASKDDKFDTLDEAYRESIQRIDRIEIGHATLPVRVVDVLPDGDCGFSALGISRDLFVDGVLRLHHFYLSNVHAPGREIFFRLFHDAIVEMRNNLSRNVLSHPFTDERWWSEIMRQQGQYWLDDEHMRLLSFVFNVRIHLYGVGPTNALVRRGIITPGVEDTIYEANPLAPRERLAELSLLHFHYNFNPNDPQHHGGNHYARLDIDFANRVMRESEQSLNPERILPTLFDLNGFDNVPEAYSKILRDINRILYNGEIRRVSVGFEDPNMILDLIERQRLAASIYVLMEQLYPTDSTFRDLFDSMLARDNVHDLHSWRDRFESSEFEIALHHLEILSYLYNYHFHIYEPDENGVLVPSFETYTENAVNRKRKGRTDIHLLNIRTDRGGHFVRIYPLEPMREEENEKISPVSHAQETIVTPLREYFPKLTLPMILSLLFITKES